MKMNYKTGRREDAWQHDNLCTPLLLPSDEFLPQWLCSMPFRLFGGHGRAAASHQEEVLKNSSSSFEVHEWNLFSSLFFCLTPTLIRVVLGLFCISGLWSHTDSWKTLLSGFAFLLKSDTSEVWKEGSARSGSPAPCHMETLLFRVSLVQNLEKLTLPLRQRTTAEEWCWAEKLPEIHVQHGPSTQYDCFVSH